MSIRYQLKKNHNECINIYKQIKPTILKKHEGCEHIKYTI